MIIGNPPYNAHQENFNHRNANRIYTGIDKAIKSTYSKEGTAQNQIIDTQSDVRNNPRISDTKNNVFGIQTGISVMFLVKTAAENKK